MTEIAGYYTNLQKGLQAQGYEVDFVGGQSHVFKYGESKNRGLAEIYSQIYNAKFKTPSKKIIKKIILSLLLKLILFGLFLQALLKHQVFIFSFGTSFHSSNFDLFILRLFKKRVISVVSHGSESRPDYIDVIRAEHFKNNFKKIAAVNKIKSKKIQRICRFSDEIIAAPATSHFITRKFVNTFQIGIPLYLSQEISDSNQDILNGDDASIRILHAPSHKKGKGTDIIRECVQALKDKSYKIEYIEISGRPNTEVLEEIAKCDFVIDQLFSDFPMAGLATEAAWMKKPSIVGGYGWKTLKSAVDETLFPPSYLCSAEDLEQAILYMIENRDYRVNLGLSAYNFLVAKWNPDLIAQKYSKIIESDVPSEWYFDPDDIFYPYGFGYTEQDVKDNIVNIVKQCGCSALGLDHRPALKKKMLDYAGVDL